MSKILQGKIISTKMTQTVSVIVERVYRHKLYKKAIIKTKKYMADTNGHTLLDDDIVKIQECRPLSKLKHFRVIKKI